jgi:hypothetical protein
MGVPAGCQRAAKRLAPSPKNAESLWRSLQIRQSRI